MWQSSQVVIADDSEARAALDAARVRQDIGPAPHLYVAALPARALNGTPKQTAAALGQLLHDDSAVVVVVVGNELGAVQGPRAPLPSGDAAAIAAHAHTATPNLQAALDTTIADIRRAGANGATNTSRTSNSGGGSAGVLWFALLIGAGLAGLLLLRRRKAQRVGRERNSGLRAEADSLYARLGSDVSTLNPRDDTVAQQALADASERYTATGALLANPRATPEVLAVAKRTAVEGIMATRVVRQRLGLDPGPDPLPTPPPNAPQVHGSQNIQVDGENYTGYGQYQPGAGHYFGGGTYQGRYIPGGWYTRPFWQTAAISAIAFGGLGYALGGGFGGDYDRGDNDTDWGGGGGDWGGGGGDWG